MSAAWCQDTGEAAQGQIANEEIRANEDRQRQVLGWAAACKCQLEAADGPGGDAEGVGPPARGNSFGPQPAPQAQPQQQLEQAQVDTGPSASA